MNLLAHKLLKQTGMHFDNRAKQLVTIAKFEVCSFQAFALDSSFIGESEEVPQVEEPALRYFFSSKISGT